MNFKHNDCIEGYNGNMTFDIRVISSNCSYKSHLVLFIQSEVRKKAKVMLHLIKTRLYSIFSSIFNFFVFLVVSVRIPDGSLDP